MRKQVMQLVVYLIAILSCAFLIVTKVSMVIPAGVALVCGVQVFKVLKRTAVLIIAKSRSGRQESSGQLLSGSFGAGVAAERLHGEVA